MKRGTYQCQRSGVRFDNAVTVHAVVNSKCSGSNTDLYKIASRFYERYEIENYHNGPRAT